MEPSEEPPATPPTAVPADPVAVEPRPSVAAKPKGWFQRLLPWISLLSGAVGAVMMDRGPKRGTFVAAAALGLWAVLLVQRWVANMNAPGRTLARMIWLARRSSLMATQSLVQLTLFFALPFYARAADLHEPAHIVFLAVLGVLGLIALWDPLTAWLYGHPELGALLPATSSFVALTAVLPGLHLSTQRSLWVASAIAGSGAAVVLLSGARPGTRWRTLPLAGLLILALPTALALGALRFVPAAPLRLVDIALGEGIADHWVATPLQNGAAAPARLVCATAIWSPIGVRDRLFHVWTHDGQERVKVELSFQGGRGAGFRTFSKITLGSHESGRFRCSVQTASGQILGSKSLQLK
jgi:hypothetical protein